MMPFDVVHEPEAVTLTAHISMNDSRLLKTALHYSQFISSQHTRQGEKTWTYVCMAEEFTAPALAVFAAVFLVGQALIRDTFIVVLIIFVIVVVIVDIFTHVVLTVDDSWTGLGWRRNVRFHLREHVCCRHSRGSYSWSSKALGHCSGSSLQCCRHGRRTSGVCRQRLTTRK